MTVIEGLRREPSRGGGSSTPKKRKTSLQKTEPTAPSIQEGSELRSSVNLGPKEDDELLAQRKHFGREEKRWGICECTMRSMEGSKPFRVFAPMFIETVTPVESSAAGSSRLPTDFGDRKSVV